MVIGCIDPIYNSLPMIILVVAQNPIMILTRIPIFSKSHSWCSVIDILTNVFACITLDIVESIAIKSNLPQVAQPVSKIFLYLGVGMVNIWCRSIVVT